MYLPILGNIIVAVWYAKSRTSEADGRNSNEIFILPMDIRKADLGISKIMNISLLDLNDMNFRS